MLCVAAVAGEQPTDGHAGKPQGTSVLWDSGSERTFCHLQAERNGDLEPQGS